MRLFGKKVLLHSPQAVFISLITITFSFKTSITEGQLSCRIEDASERWVIH